MKKGITPLVGTALLVLIAISAVTTAGIFLRDTTQEVKGSVNDQLSQDQRIERSGIDIEYAYNNSDGEVSIVVRNTGEYTLTVEEGGQRNWNVYADGEPQSYTYPGGSADNKVLDPGESLTIDSNSGFPNGGSYKTFTVSGSYETESSIICHNGGDGQC